MKLKSIVELLSECNGVSIPHPDKPGSRVLGFSVPCEKLETELGTKELGQLTDTIQTLHKNSKRNLHDPDSNAKDKLRPFDYHIILYTKGWYKVTDTMDDIKTIISIECCIDKQFIGVKDVIKLLVGTVSDLGQFNDYNVSELLCDALFPFLNPRNLNPHELIIHGLLSIIRQTISKDLPIPEPDTKYLPLSNEDSLVKWRNMHNRNSEG